MAIKQKRRVKYSFLAERLKEGLRELFGEDVSAEKIIELWEDMHWANKPRYKSKFEPRVRDAAVSAGLIDNGELRQHEFYRGAIAGILSRYLQGRHDKGIDPDYAIPIAYCFSRLEELASS